MSARPKISRRKVVTAALDMLENGKSVKQVAAALAAYLVANGQTRNTELYIRDIELTAAERFGVVTAYVASARELGQQARNQITKLVKNTTGAKTIEMVEHTEPELIGGVIVRTADAELDGSVRTKLRNLRSI